MIYQDIVHKNKYSSHLVFLFILLNIYFCRSSFAQSKTDSLLTELSKAKEDTNKVNLLNALSSQLMNNNPDTAFLLGNQALSLANKLKWKKGNANSLGNLGIVYYEQGDYPKALEHYFKALEITKVLGNKRNISALLGNIGNVYKDQGYYPRALEHYFKSLEIFKELGDKGRIAGCLSNIGIVYMNQGDYPKALEHYFKALELNKVLGNKRGIAIRLGNIGIVYNEQGDLSRERGDIAQANRDYPKALEHYFKALEIAKELGDKYGISIHLCNIGALYTKLKRYPSAEEYLNNSLRVAEEIGSINMIKDDHRYLSELFVELAMEKRANGQKTKGQWGKGQIGNGEMDKWAMDNRQSYYLKAYAHYEKYLQAKDTLFNEEKSENMGKMEARHEFALIEMEQERAEKEEIRRAGERVKRRDQVQFTGIIALLLVVILIVSLILFSKFNISSGIKTGSLFIALMLLFEFMLVWFDPSIEKFTGGDPFFKLGINAVLAIVFYFIQKYTERILLVNKLTIQKTNNPVLSFLILILVVPLLGALATSWQENNSHQSTKTLNPTKNETIEHSNNRTNEHSNIGAINLSTHQPINKSTHSKTDSLKALLSMYQTQITVLRSQNKIKEALELLKKYGSVKDSLQSQEQSQEFTRLNEKHALELQKAKQKAEEEERAKLEKEKKARTNLLKYSIILIAIIFLFIALSVTGRIRLGKFTLPHSVLEGGLFVSFLLLFEFLLVFADPYVEQYTGGAPAWKFGFNVVIAFGIFPVHHFLEEKMRGRMFRAKRRMVEKNRITL